MELSFFFFSSGHDNSCVLQLCFTTHKKLQLVEAEFGLNSKSFYIGHPSKICSAIVVTND